MKIIKRILLVLLVLLVLAQIPFIYRRYQTGQLANKISEAAKIATDHPIPEDLRFKEYKGIIHAHTNLGGHSTGSFDELIAAANANDLDFVLMTEHFSETVDTAEKTLNGVYGKTLFVGGNEIETTDSDRFLLIPGGGEAAKARMYGTTAFLEAAHRENKLALITYPERFKSWDSNFDGIEVFNLHTAAKQMNWLTALGDLIWSYPSYPELTFAKNFTRPDANLAKFDEVAAKRPISLFAGTDAHSDLGLHFIGSDGGQKLINIKLDPYETIFRIARVHVLIEKDKPLDRDTLIEGIRAGRYFIGFDALGDTTGFRFEANEFGMDEARYSMGDKNPTVGSTLNVAAPARECRLLLYLNGQPIADGPIGDGFSYESKASGAYRVEVYRDDLGPPFDKMPWIISNPIYVR